MTLIKALAPNKIGGANAVNCWLGLHSRVVGIPRAQWVTAHGTPQFHGQCWVVPRKGASCLAASPPGLCRGQFSIPQSCGCPSPGLNLAEALQNRDTCGYHQPFPNHLQGAASLLLPSLFLRGHLETNVLMQRWQPGVGTNFHLCPSVFGTKNGTWDKSRARSPAPCLR